MTASPPPGRSRESAIPRPAARAIVLDAEDRVLLIRAEWDGRSLWFTPGGRLDPGETPAAAARRELREETGLDPGTLRWEGVVWIRDWTWRWAEGDTWFASHEQFFVARLPVRGGELPRAGHAAHSAEEVLVLREMRWWDVEALRASGEPTSPSRLPALLPAIIAGARPDPPLAIGE